MVPVEIERSRRPTAGTPDPVRRRRRPHRTPNPFARSRRPSAPAAPAAPTARSRCSRCSTSPRRRRTGAPRGRPHVSPQSGSSTAPASVTRPLASGSASRCGATIEMLARGIGGEIAAVLGQIGHAQHRRTIEQSIGEERCPRIAVGGQRRQRARIGRRGDRARFLGGRRANRIGDSGERGRDRRGIARVAVITGRHVGTIPNTCMVAGCTTINDGCVE